MPNKKLEHDRLVRGIAKGALLVLVATIFSRILGYFIRAMIARYYGAEVYGLLSTSLALFSIITTILLLGFPTSLTRQISFNISKNNLGKIKSIISSAYFISTLFSLIISILLFSFSGRIAGNFFNNPQLEIFFKYFSASIIFYIWLKINANIFRAYKKMVGFILLKDLLRYSLVLLLILIAIFNDYPSNRLGFLYFISFAFLGLMSIFASVLFLPFKNYKGSFNLSKIGSLFQFSWPLMMASIIYIFLYRLDIIMIGYFENQTQVGIYNAAVPIGELIMIVTQSFTPFLLPVMTEYFAKNSFVELKNTFEISTKWILIFTLPIFNLIIAYPKFFILILFGKSFIQAVPALQIISFGFVTSAVISIATNVLIVSGRTKLHLFNNSVTIIVNFILNFILIPKYGIMGGASATAISLLILNGLSISQVYFNLKIQPFNLITLRILVVSLLPLSILLLLPLRATNLYIGILIFCIYGVIYFLLLKFLKCFDENDKIVFDELKKRIF